jgi:hypothetical protein
MIRVPTTLFLHGSGLLNRFDQFVEPRAANCGLDFKLTDWRFPNTYSEHAPFFLQSAFLGKILNFERTVIKPQVPRVDVIRRECFRPCQMPTACSFWVCCLPFYLADRWLYLGYGGRLGVGTGFLLSSSITTATAFSSCGSCPSRTALGSYSTSISGGTP